MTEAELRTKLALTMGVPRDAIIKEEKANTTREESIRISAQLASRGVHDILLVTVDALRADHVGAYGYDRPTTPNLDRLARQGAMFLRAYCPTPHTSYSITSMMTGKNLRPLLSLSQADLHVRFRPATAWLDRNQMVKGMIGLIQNARQGDGSYVFTFTGPLARMTPRPGR